MSCWNSSWLGSALVAASLAVGCGPDSKPTVTPMPGPETSVRLNGTPIKSSGADAIFEKRRLFPVDLARPDDLTGSLVYLVRRSGAEDQWYYEPLANEKPKLEKVGSKLFESIVDRKFLADAKVSLFVSVAGTMDDQDKAEVVVQDLYTLTGPEKSQLEKQISDWTGRSSGLSVVELYYCRAVRISSAISRIYRKVAVAGEISGPAFGVNGEYYSVKSEYVAQSFLTWDPVPVGLPGAKGGGPEHEPPLQMRSLERAEAPVR